MQAPLGRAIKATSSLSVRRAQSVHDFCSLPRFLHTTSCRRATPLPHPTVPGPPPSAPQAAVDFSVDRVSRKRQQAEALQEAQRRPVNPSKPSSALQKRFWKNVSVHETDDGLQIHLDKRPVRTATRQVLNLPKHKRSLAGGIALEWDQLVSAQQALKQHYVPLTSLSSRAIDIVKADAQNGQNNETRNNLISMLMRYLATDTLLCWAPERSLHEPEQAGVKSLRQRQKEVAEPIIAFLTTHIFPGVSIKPTLDKDSIIPAAQPEVTTSVIRGWVSGLPAFELAALERAVLATKSLLVAARLVVEWSPEFAHLRSQSDPTAACGERSNSKFGIEEAAEAASLEVLHQTEMWGEVEDTHDVEREDLRRQLGSAILLIC